MPRGKSPIGARRELRNRMADAMAQPVQFGSVDLRCVDAKPAVEAVNGLTMPPVPEAVCPSRSGPDRPQTARSIRALVPPSCSRG